MTHHPPTTPIRRARLRRGLAVAAIAATATVAQSGGEVDAALRTQSPAIAEEADRALESLESWQTERNPADYVRFVTSRGLTAAMTAVDLGLDPTTLRAEWASVPMAKQEAVLAAMSQLGVPYRSHKSDPEVGFDCSGLTSWAFAQAGLELPRVSRDQIRAAERVDEDEATAGDLTYYPGHIAIYIGAGSIVHSPNSGNHVEAVAEWSTRSLTYGDPFGGDGDS
jgi:cell wall-associated NlpC family hydrolase